MVSQKTMMYGFFGLLGIVALVVVAMIMGVGITPTSGALQPGQVAAGQVTTEIPATQTFFDASNGVNLLVEVRETIPDSTGLKNRIGMSVGVYDKDSTTPFDTIIATPAGFIQGATTANVGQELFLVGQNATHYTVKSDVMAVPSIANYKMTMYADRLNTLTVTGQNTTSGSWAATSMGQLLTTDEARTLQVRLEGATARGVYRHPTACFNYDTLNFSRCEVTNAGAVKLTQSLAGVASGYEECWDTGIDSITHYDAATLGVRCTPVAGVDPNDTVTVRIIDYGTFVKQSNGVVFNDYQNTDTLADVSATNYDFVIGIW